MNNSITDFDPLMNKVISVFNQFGLQPISLGLTIQISKEQYASLSQRFPSRLPKFFSISSGNNEWTLNVYSALEPSEYPNALSLQPDTFSIETRKEKRTAKKK